MFIEIFFKKSTFNPYLFFNKTAFLAKNIDDKFNCDRHMCLILDHNLLESLFSGHEALECHRLLVDIPAISHSPLAKLSYSC